MTAIPIRPAGGQQILANGPDDQSFVSVAELQSRLIDLGYYDGPVDGKLSHVATTALAKFQHDHGLPATGEPDDVTLQTLRDSYCY